MAVDLVITFVSVFCAINLVYVRIVWLIWNAHFKYNRVCRSHPACPSNKSRPAASTPRELGDQLRAATSMLSCRWLSIVKVAMQLDNARQPPARLWQNAMVRCSTRELVQDGTRELDISERAEQLDMDHNYMDFVDFLWCYYVVAPCSGLLALRGYVALAARKIRQRVGLARPCPNPHRVVGELLLETTLLIHYAAKHIDSGKTECSIATFCFNQFPLLSPAGQLQVASLLAVELDLDTKSMLHATLDDRELSANEVIILLSFYLSFTHHVKTHAIANWGGNSMSTDPFLQRCAVVTTVYNFFGYTIFRYFVNAAYAVGLIRNKCAGLEGCFDAGLKAGVPFHANCRELMQHSVLCEFVIKLRAYFLREFDVNFKNDMPGIEGEALFIGTILHSLDHVMLEQIISDPLWFDVGSQSFGLMAELVSFVRSGFVPDIPFLTITQRYKDAGHPFFQKVYQRAARLNKFLADNMDVCIVK